MSQTVRIIYSIATGQPRRVIISDEDLTPHKNGIGEAFLDVDYQQFLTMGSDFKLRVEKSVSTIANVNIQPSLYAVVNGLKTVTNILVLDPLCGDAIKNSTIVPVTINQVQIGATFSGGVFTNPINVNLG